MNDIPEICRERPETMGCQQAIKWSQRRRSTTLRKVVFARDRGICTGCGIDTVLIEEEFHSVGSGLHPDTRWFEQQAWLRKHGFGRNRSTFWEMDHIIPISEGGDPHDVGNLRTVCIPCHRALTAALRNRQVARRAMGKSNSA